MESGLFALFAFAIGILLEAYLSVKRLENGKYLDEQLSKLRPYQKALKAGGAILLLWVILGAIMYSFSPSDGEAVLSSLLVPFFLITALAALAVPFLVWPIYFKNIVNEYSLLALTTIFWFIVIFYPASIFHFFSFNFGAGCAYPLIFLLIANLAVLYVSFTNKKAGPALSLLLYAWFALITLVIAGTEYDYFASSASEQVFSEGEFLSLESILLMLAGGMLLVRMLSCILASILLASTSFLLLVAYRIPGLDPSIGFNRFFEKQMRRREAILILAFMCTALMLNEYLQVVSGFFMVALCFLFVTSIFSTSWKPLESMEGKPKKKS